MKLSILLPFRDAAPWIEETLASIQAQSMMEWELICVNDNSTDDSTRIVERMSGEDKRITLIHNSDKGIIPALRLAFNRATGTYITRMDADDLMPEDRLEKMISLLDTLPKKTIVTGKVEYFSDDEVSLGYRTYEQWLNARVDLSDYYDQIFRECVVASPNWMARRSDFESDHIFEKLSYPEDYDMTFHWMQLGYTIHSIDAVTLLWREHPDRTSRNSSIYDQVSFFELKIKWFQRLNDLDKQSVGIMGAGRKGKLTARIFRENSVKFNWYDLNFENYSGQLDGCDVLDYRSVNDPLLLIAIYPDDLTPLTTFLASKGYVIGENAWFL
ncbi:MAG: glycosyltransferase involved in cell wall biosynthesis [Crocinitomicaceae bacterium]|jgi:glycosyltransferase involved in cell wall biosynthesis